MTITFTQSEIEQAVREEAEKALQAPYRIASVHVFMNSETGEPEASVAIDDGGF